MWRITVLRDVAYAADRNIVTRARFGWHSTAELLFEPHPRTVGAVRAIYAPMYEFGWYP